MSFGGKGIVGGLEAAAVIGDEQCQLIRMIAEIHGDLSRVCVTGDVCEGFLRDAKGFSLNGRSEGAIGASDGEIDMQPGRSGLLRQSGKARGKGVLRGDGAEIPDASAGFGEALADVGAGAVDLLMGGGDLRLSEELRGEFELDGDADKTLRECVMNLTGHTIALCEHGVEL